MENSKVFSRSRDRSHQSIHGSRHKMNQSSMQKDYKNVEKIMLQSNNPKPQISVLTSNISANTVAKHNQNAQIKITQSLTLHKTNQGMQNNAVKQLQRQFKQFKQSVYKQLQRQQDLINKMIKQIVFTFEYELNKLKTTQTVPVQQNKINQSDFVTPLKEKIPTLEDVKAKLNTNNSNPIFQKVQYSNKSKETFNQQSEKKKIKQISFNCTNQLKFDRFFQLMNKLKSDVKEIHQIGMLASPLTSPRGEEHNNFFEKNKKENQKTNNLNSNN